MLYVIRGFITSKKVAQMLLNSLKDKVILSSSDRYKISPMIDYGLKFVKV